MANPKKPPGYSFSALEIYHGGDVHGGCPLAYKLNRLDKIPRADSEPLIIGRMLHELAARYLLRLIDVGLQTDWDYARAITPKEAPADVLEIWPRHYENFVMPASENHGVELKLAFDRNWQPCEFFSPQAFFRMVVDWTFTQGGLAVIKDFKSNRQIINVDLENIPLQLRIYGWGARRALYPDAEEILLQLHFMRYGAEREILLTPGDLDTVPAELEAKIAEIEADKHFDPRPGSYCSMCGVQSHCKVMADALVPVEVLAPATREQAEKAATLLLAVREMDKMITGRLKGYVQEFGPVHTGDLIYGPVPGISYDLDPETVSEQLLESGIDREIVWKAMNVSKSSINSALSKGDYKGKRKQEREAIIEAILSKSESKPTEEIRFFKAQ